MGIIIAVLIILLAGGGYFYAMNRAKTMTTTPVLPTKAASAFTSIQDALTKSLSLKCDYTYNTIHTVAYIKNGMVRSDVVDTKDASLSGSVIIKDKKIYYWNAQKVGFMMAMPEISVTPSISPAVNSGQSALQNLEKYKNSCKVAAVGDDLFVLPSDITFTDQTQMMRLQPTGTSGTNYQQQAQQYMQQYHITPQQ